MNQRRQKQDRSSGIDALVASAQLTQSGADWVKLRTDPYHDFDHTLEGYPDANNFDSVVSCLNYQVEVSKPAAATGNWDMHVFTMPFAGETMEVSTSVSGVVTKSTDSYQLGILNVAKADAGQALFPDLDPVVSTNFEMAPIDGFATPAQGLSRIVGMGFEVIDTSSELNKQGVLLAYRMPESSDSRSFTRTIQIDAKFGSMDYYGVASPPATMAAAALYKGSVQWEGRQGVYVSCGQQGIDNPFMSTERAACLIAKDLSLAGTDVVLTSDLTTSAGVAAPNVSCLVPATKMKRFNLSQHGVFINGCNKDSTYTVRCRVYLERAPLLEDVDLIPLASPSPVYDYKALALYSMVVSNLPPAVPVSFNAKGDWWRMIVNVIKKVAAPVGLALSPFLGPEAGAIGGLVTEMAGLVPTGRKNKVVQPKVTAPNRGQPQGKQKPRRRNK